MSRSLCYQKKNWNFALDKSMKRYATERSFQTLRSSPVFVIVKLMIDFQKQKSHNESESKQQNNEKTIVDALLCRKR